MRKEKGKRTRECLCQLGDHPFPSSPGFYQPEVGKGPASGREWVLPPLEQHIEEKGWFCSDAN